MKGNWLLPWAALHSSSNWQENIEICRVDHRAMKVDAKTFYMTGRLVQKSWPRTGPSWGNNSEAIKSLQGIWLMVRIESKVGTSKESWGLFVKDTKARGVAVYCWDKRASEISWSLRPVLMLRPRPQLFQRDWCSVLRHYCFGRQTFPKGLALETLPPWAQQTEPQRRYQRKPTWLVWAESRKHPQLFWRAISLLSRYLHHSENNQIPLHNVESRFIVS